MAIQVVEERHGATACLTFANPPLNAISVGVGLVYQISKKIEEALACAEIEQIILVGADGNFSAGADIHDFDLVPERLNDIRALFSMIAAAQKPIIAAIEGFCYGGGLELALAAHYRVASEKARFAFPEITLGLLPGSGGTQRAPRLIGAERALDLMLDGQSMSAERAHAIGLIDRLILGSKLKTADILTESRDLNLVRSPDVIPVPLDVARAVATARERKGITAAGKRVIDCVEAIGTGSIADGLALEASLFAELMASSESRALRHGFFGRRSVARLSKSNEIEPHRITAATIIGGGLMGTGIASALLNADIAVTVVEPLAERRARLESAISATMARDLQKERVSADRAEARLQTFRTVGQLDDALDAELFIEAVFEDMDVKRDIFTALDRLAPPEAVLASNTSTLDIDAIAGFISRPDRFVGLHFFSPANVMKLLEIVKGARTSRGTLATAMAFARQIGKTGVVAGVCDGFIGNRIFEEYLRQAWFLLEEGALPHQIDTALETFGMAMGPCRVMDLAGQDIGWSIRKRRKIEQPDRPYSRIPDIVCERGRFGQKVGAGFYRYSGGRTAEVDSEVEALIIAESARIGLERRRISDDEVIERCVLSMVNEGARIVGEGIAARPVDVDIVYLDGYGFPAFRGGPMFFADELGLPKVLGTIRGFAEQRHGWAWKAAPLLVELVEQARGFRALNQ